MTVASGTEKAADPRAREAARCLDKTLKALLLYPPTNPTPERFKRELLEALAAAAAAGGPLVFVASGAELTCRGASVHRDSSAEEGLAAALVRDGIRSVTFSPGVETAELDAFLGALARRVKDRRGEEDLAVLLWSAPLKRIAYETVGELEDPDAAARRDAALAKAAETERSGGGGGTGSGGVGAGAGGAGRTDGAAAGGEGAGGPGRGTGDAARAIDSMEVSGILEKLADVGTEHDSLELLRAEAASFDAVESTLQVLRELADEEAPAAETAETAGLLEALYDGFLDQGDFASARRALETAAAAAGAAAGAPREARLRAVAAHAAEPASFGRLRAALDDAGADLEAARRLVDALPPEAVLRMVEALGALERRPARKLMCDALVGRGPDAVDDVGRAAGDPRWYVVRNAAMILGRVGGPRACVHLGATLGHRSDAVRREAVEALARMDSPEARAALRPALHDPDPRLRLRALGALARGGSAEDAEKVEARVRAPDFRLLPPEEQQEWLETLASLRGDAALPVFKDLVRRRLMWWRSRARLRAAAAYALAMSDGPLSRGFLETLARGRDRRVREAARAALERLARRTGGGARG